MSGHTKIPNLTGTRGGIAQALHQLFPALPVHTPWLFAALAELSAVTIGLAAGVVPAQRAAQLDPVEALHAE